LHNAIAQMEDLGWCPIVGCGSIANVERSENQGRCQHCEFLFCLGCKSSAHPFKRCLLNRIDLNQDCKEEIEKIMQTNADLETKLNVIFFKYCTKPCPN
jgi:hypothetical protein